MVLTMLYGPRIGSVIGGTMVLTVLWAQSRQSETDRELSKTETEIVRVY